MASANFNIRVLFDGKEVDVYAVTVRGMMPSGEVVIETSAPLSVAETEVSTSADYVSRTEVLSLLARHRGAFANKSSLIGLSDLVRGLRGRK